ncbi:PLVAP protein, partial [Regulus satrapa]|nr:PLVAP protein [Regulus satrapa]
MEKSSFAMAKFGLEQQQQHKEASAKRDCGFYVKYIFLFTSLIQFLIILGLVLFMVYGNAQAGTDTHLRLLEEQLQSHYRRAVALGAANANLSRALNATLRDKERLQGQALKVQRELERCNSSQAAGGAPQVSAAVAPGVVRVWPRPNPVPPLPFPSQAEKLQLQRQLDQATSSKKNLEESGRQCQAELAKATQERESCQQDLQIATAEGDFSRTQLQLQKHECSSVQSDLSEKFPRALELVKQYRCGEAEKELRNVRDRAEELLRRQQERDSRFMWRDSCEMSMERCRLNCSRERQELQRRLQGLQRSEREAAEERKRAEAERERAGKELEERRRAAAAQAEALREQLAVCMGAKVGT